MERDDLTNLTDAELHQRIAAFLERHAKVISKDAQREGDALAAEITRRLRQYLPSDPHSGNSL